MDNLIKTFPAILKAAAASDQVADGDIIIDDIRKWRWRSVGIGRRAGDQHRIREPVIEIRTRPAHRH